MSNKEVSLQYDMFSSELVDTRTATQKRAAKRAVQPQQIEMFRQKDIAQFGVNARPTLPISPKTRLELIAEDHRSDEEKVRDMQREAEKKNYALFSTITAIVPYTPLERCVAVVDTPPVVQQPSQREVLLLPIMPTLLLLTVGESAITTSAHPQSEVNEDLLRFHQAMSIGLAVCTI
jgi:hypothetical protein